MCRSRRELSNEYLLAKIGVDTAENEPLEVWEKIQFNIHFSPYRLRGARRTLQNRHVILKIGFATKHYILERCVKSCGLCLPCGAWSSNTVVSTWAQVGFSVGINWPEDLAGSLEQLRQAARHATQPRGIDRRAQLPPSPQIEDSQMPCYLIM